MTEKRIALRFDVDTSACIRTGMPALLYLANKYNIPVTFYVNMGRAVSYKVIACRLFLKGKNIQGSIAKLSAFEKLGVMGVLQAALVNPYVGKSNREIIARSLKAGHEIGLHGGQNHAVWQFSASDWSRDEVEKQVAWGMKELCFLPNGSVTSFSSPGWSSNTLLPEILLTHGITVLADDHQSDREGLLDRQSKGVTRINTNLAGEPGGVGYLESCEAKDISYQAMCESIAGKLSSFDSLVMYDHPSYAGGKGIGRLERLIIFLKGRGVDFTTVSGLAG